MLALQFYLLHVSKRFFFSKDRYDCSTMVLVLVFMLQGVGTGCACT